MTPPSAEDASSSGPHPAESSADAPGAGISPAPVRSLPPQPAGGSGLPHRRLHGIFGDLLELPMPNEPIANAFGRAAGASIRGILCSQLALSPVYFSIWRKVHATPD